MNYYERHLGDYARATLHLSLLEHGVYSILLDRYYSTEQPIPDGQVYRVALARTRAERRAVDAVLQEFFYLDGDVWRHRRCDEEIGAARARMDASRANGAKGGRPRKEAAIQEEHGLSHRENGSQTETQTEPRQNLDETQTKPSRNLNKTQTKPRQKPTNHQSPITNPYSVPIGTAAKAADAGAVEARQKPGENPAGTQPKPGEDPNETQTKPAGCSEQAPSAVEPLPAAVNAAGLSKPQVWQAALSLLATQGMPEPQARAFVGSLAKDLGGDSDALEELVRSAVAEQPVDARAWLKAACQKRNGTRGAARRIGAHNGLLSIDHKQGLDAFVA